MKKLIAILGIILLNLLSILNASEVLQDFNIDGEFNYQPDTPLVLKGDVTFESSSSGTLTAKTLKIKPGFKVKQGAQLILGTEAKLNPEPVFTGIKSFGSEQNYYLANQNLFITNDGKVWGIGYNAFGQIIGGHGSEPFRKPIEVKLPGPAKSVAAGENANYILLENGELWGFGVNSNGVMGNTGPSNPFIDNPKIVLDASHQVEKMFLGYDSSMIIKKDGSVWAVGNNARGMFGVGATVTNYKNYTQIIAPEFDGGSGVKSLSLGYQFCIYLMNNGNVWAAGLNDKGQLGDGTTNSSDQLIKIMDGVQSITTGHSHTLMIKNNALYVNGSSNYYQLGIPNETTVLIPTVVLSSGVQKVSCGFFHCTVLKDDGFTYAVGLRSTPYPGNTYGGTFGDGNLIGFEAEYTKVENLGNVKEVSVGHFHSIAQTDDNKIWMTGYYPGGTQPWYDAYTELTFEFVVNNNSPVVSSTPLQDITVEQSEGFSFTLGDGFIDIDAAHDVNERMIYDVSITPYHPSTMNYLTVTGDFFNVGNFSSADVGKTFNVMVTVTDVYGAKASDNFNFTVTYDNNPPFVVEGNEIPNATVNEHDTFIYTVVLDGDNKTFDDPDVTLGDKIESLTAKFTDGRSLPAGAFNGQSFAWTTGDYDVGVQTIELTATDSNGANVSTTFQVTVNNFPDPPKPPEEPIIGEAKVNLPFLYTIPANGFSDPDPGDTVTIELNEDPTGLPIWLTYDEETAIFSGMPDQEDISSFDVKVKAIDNTGLSVNTTITINVQPNE